MCHGWKTALHAFFTAPAKPKHEKNVSSSDRQTSFSLRTEFKHLTTLPTLMQESFWCRHCSVWERYLLSPPHGISVSVPASTSPEMTQLVGGRTSVRYRFGSPFSSKILRFVDTLVTVSPTIIETLKWLSSLLIVVQESSWWWQCSDRYNYNLPLPPPTYPLPLFSPSLISLVVSVNVKHHVHSSAFSTVVSVDISLWLCSLQ